MFTHIPEKLSCTMDFRIRTKHPDKGIISVTSLLGQCPFFILKANTLCKRFSSYISIPAEEEKYRKCLSREILFDLLMEFRVK